MKGRCKKRKASASPKLASNNLRGDSIEKRPQEADGRKVPGHWEPDLVVGCKGSKKTLLVLTERSTRYEKTILLPDKSQKGVAAALNRLERRYGANHFRAIFKTITSGNDPEFLDFRAIGKSRSGSVPRTKVFAPIRFLPLKGEATGTPTG